jgi:hypothetical protein
VESSPTLDPNINCTVEFSQLEHGNGRMVQDKLPQELLFRPRIPLPLPQLPRSQHLQTLIAKTSRDSLSEKRRSSSFCRFLLFSVNINGCVYAVCGVWCENVWCENVCVCVVSVMRLKGRGFLRIFQAKNKDLSFLCIGDYGFCSERVFFFLGIGGYGFNLESPPCCHS